MLVEQEWGDFNSAKGNLGTFNSMLNSYNTADCQAVEEMHSDMTHQVRGPEYRISQTLYSHQDDDSSFLC